MISADRNGGEAGKVLEGHRMIDLVGLELEESLKVIEWVGLGWEGSVKVRETQSRLEESLKTTELRNGWFGKVLKGNKMGYIERDLDDQRTIERVGRVLQDHRTTERERFRLGKYLKVTG